MSRASRFAVGLALVIPAGALDAQWSVSMRAMQNPLAVGQCTPIEVVAMVPGGGAPVRADGRQVSGFDFDLDLAAQTDAFAWQDEHHRTLCAIGPTATSAVVVATYPARHLKPTELVPGISLQQALEVAVAGVPGGVYAGSPAPSPQGYGTNAYPQPNPAPAAYPAPGGPGQGYPAPAYPAPAYPAPNAQTYGSTPAVGYPEQTYAYPAPGTYPQAQPAPAPPPSQAPVPDSGVRSGKQFLQRVTGFAKRKAGEVATSTTTQVADATGEVIGNTMETGGQVVTSGVGSVTGSAGNQVRSVGQALGVAPQTRDPEDVAAALAEGRAVLYGLRFTEGTAILEPGSGALIGRIAGALARTPGQFLIEAHVDGRHSPAAQALSEQRAAAVKAALVAAGSSPMQLAAVGYGATRPVQGGRRNARIEIARTQ